MKTKLLSVVRSRILAVSTLFCVCGSAWGFALPAGPCTGSNCLQYSDFSVYSLALINLQNGGSGSPTNGQAGYVEASPGQIKDYVVLGLNSNNNAAQTNIPGVDNAYNTPSGGTFTTKTSDTTNGPGAGDGNSWQASISVLNNEFLSNKFVAFFAFTEPGTSSPPQPLLGADLLIWAKVSAIDLQNQFAPKTFYLQPNGSLHDDDPLASPLPPDTTLGDSGPWVYVHSKMCVGPGSSFAGFPDGAGNCPLGSQIKDTNTGQNNASFALYNEDLDGIIHDINTPYDILQVDWEMAYVDGDGETAWIQPFEVSNTPEPATPLLIALALIVMSRSQIKRKL